jgi:peptide/nickel transport system permease protein
LVIAAESAAGAGTDIDRATPRTGRGGAIARQAGRMVLVLFLVSFFSFALVSALPGDAATVVAGENATPQQVEIVRQELGLNEPIPVRYVHWLTSTLQGNLGRSFQTNQPVAAALADRVPVSFELMILAQVVALGIAVPVAMYSAYRPEGLVDRLSMATGFTFAAVPQFIWALILILLFAGGALSILPATGYVPFLGDPIGNLRTMVLPTLTLALPEAAVYRQLLRSDITASLQEDFVVLARTKGLADRHILFRHALRPSLFSVFTLAGVNIGRLLGGTVIVETIFAVPGVGQMVFQSVQGRDYPMLQGALLFIATAYVLVNIAVDLFYPVLDPRLRHAR